MVIRHKALITSSSLFFQRATKPEWRTDPLKPIDLSDEKPPFFEKYIQWLYTNTVPPNAAATDPYKYLALMYVLGEKIMDQAFQDAILATMIEHCAAAPSQHKYPCLDAINVIYDGTTDTSPARRLVVDFWAYNMTPNWRVGEVVLLAHLGFLQDLLPALLGKRGMPDMGVERPWVLVLRIIIRCVIESLNANELCGND